MKRFVPLASAALALAAVVTFALTTGAGARPSVGKSPWGPDDELGRLNRHPRSPRCWSAVKPL